MKKLILGAIFCASFIIAGFAINSAEAEMQEGTNGKACPDIMLDTCCESGAGSCGPTVPVGG